MKKTFTLLFLLTAFTFGARAQQTKDGFKLNLGLEGGLPINSTSYDLTAGLFAKAEFPLSGSLKFTANAAFTKFFFTETLKEFHEANGDNEVSGTWFPVLAGVRYYLPSGFYGEAQLGAAFGSKSASKGVNGDIYPDTGTAFAYTPGVGYALPLKNGEAVDFGVRYEAWHKNATLDFVSLRVAYKFNW